MEEMSRPSKLSLGNVFLRGFVNMWRTYLFHKLSESSLFSPRSQAKTESCSVSWNRFLEVLVTLIVEHLVDVPTSCFKTELSSGLMQVSDNPVPLVVEELVEVGLHSFSHIGFNIVLWNRSWKSSNFTR